MQIDRPIAIALILFVILLLAFFLVVPEYNTFNDLRNQLAEKTAEYNAEYDYYSAITKTYMELQSRKDDLQKIDDAMPQDPNLGKLVYYLQDAATENGLMVKDLFLSKSASGGNSATVNPQNISTATVKDVVFSMDLIGGYSSLESFMASLEKSSRIFEVTNISFSYSDMGSGGVAATKNESQFSIPQTFLFNLQIKTHSYQ